MKEGVASYFQYFILSQCKEVKRSLPPGEYDLAPQQRWQSIGDRLSIQPEARSAQHGVGQLSPSSTIALGGNAVFRDAFCSKAFR